MVEVFKTNICDAGDAAMVLDQLSVHFPVFECNFDLEDCDHILRISTGYEQLNHHLILQLVSGLGFTIEVLSDEVFSR